VKRKYNMICINDDDENLDYDKVKRELESYFLTMFPEKSCFEK